MLLEMAQSWLKLAEQVADDGAEAAIGCGCESAVPDAAQPD
jgi:hypothetical protein